MNDDKNMDNNYFYGKMMYNESKHKYGLLDFDLWEVESFDDGDLVEYWDKDTETWTPATMTYWGSPKKWGIGHLSLSEHEGIEARAKKDIRKDTISIIGRTRQTTYHNVGREGTDFVRNLLDAAARDNSDVIVDVASIKDNDGMTGMKLDVLATRELLKRGEYTQESAMSKIRCREFLDRCYTRDIYDLFDSGYFNEIAEGYLSNTLSELIDSGDITDSQAKLIKDTFHSMFDSMRAGEAVM